MTNREEWNERYTARGALWGQGPNQFVADRLQGWPPQRVLDLGSGQGRNAIWLAQQGHTVTAVDLSDVASRQAQDIAEAAGVEVDFVAADLSQWEPPPAAFDLVLLSYLQVPDAMRRMIHAKAKKALASQGHVFVVAHHAANLEHGVGGPPNAEVLFTEDQLAGDFSGFEVVESGRAVRRVDKDGVQGDAIDVVFIARKP
jgi:16S rRNA G1207 methylase RsmC